MRSAPKADAAAAIQKPADPPVGPEVLKGSNTEADDQKDAPFSTLVSDLRSTIVVPPPLSHVFASTTH